MSDKRVIAAAPRPLIPELIYVARLIEVQRGPTFGKPRFFFINEIIRPLDETLYGVSVAATRLTLACTAPRDGVMRPSQKLYQTCVAAMGEVPAAGEEIDFDQLIGREYIVVVRTVTHDSKRRPLPEAARYSVIDRIVGPYSSPSATSTRSSIRVSTVGGAPAPPATASPEPKPQPTPTPGTEFSTVYRRPPPKLPSEEEWLRREGPRPERYGRSQRRRPNYEDTNE